VLLNGPRTDVQLGCDLFIAAALHQEFENLLIAPGDFDLLEIQHADSFLWASSGMLKEKHVFRQPFAAMRSCPTTREHSTWG
jgi:hypothetical protein